MEMVFQLSVGCEMDLLLDTLAVRVTSIIPHFSNTAALQPRFSFSFCQNQAQSVIEPLSSTRPLLADFFLNSVTSAQLILLFRSSVCYSHDMHFKGTIRCSSYSQYMLLVHTGVELTTCHESR